MKRLALIVVLLMLSAPLFAEVTVGDDRDIAGFDIKTDEIKVSAHDSVPDGCLLNPRTLIKTAEAELRRLGFKVAGKGSVTRVSLTMSAMSVSKLSSKNGGGQNGCSAMLSLYLYKMVASGKRSSTMVPIWSNQGLFTTTKLDMTEQMQADVREYMNELYLEIMRAPVPTIDP